MLFFFFQIPDIILSFVPDCHHFTIRWYCTDYTQPLCYSHKYVSHVRYVKSTNTEGKGKWRQCYHLPVPYRNLPRYIYSATTTADNAATAITTRILDSPVDTFGAVAIENFSSYKKNK